MIIEEGYLGYLKYDGNAIEEGIMDARLSAEALLGFDEAFRQKGFRIANLVQGVGL